VVAADRFFLGGWAHALSVFFTFFLSGVFFKGFNFLVSATFFARCFEFFAGMWIASRFWRWQAKKWDE
jgi:hypothetical protein